MQHNTDVGRIEAAQNTAERLKSTNVLTPREADAYAFRSIYNIPRGETADALGVSKSRVDNALRSAKDAIAGARILINMLDDTEIE
ncbi:hypothetical protein EXE46_12550 [Halorubrum sp. GN11_10-6_MGM]|uniref:hypothetical protein n=1 Tax=Halorubrum sp. GN11_10-6_MGM TaxID=2518112 RepID=UPI0010F81607|nr:hypothetical protein [Halorubrum sp. GN11_10-6_MGM]TKX73771.1 hypothetical protein EXE46_12550 [Halorubrum sp. GN11_10-6_MGM]